jgi:hypothetical protein
LIDLTTTGMDVHKYPVGVFLSGINVVDPSTDRHRAIEVAFGNSVLRQPQQTPQS